ncbi:hypothetical protein HDU96_002892 [Phlyctochytrium bullatum]|nr:hypothetical protein HDU96_002892 [Phlyctochytrium bullatum]
MNLLTGSIALSLIAKATAQSLTTTTTTASPATTTFDTSPLAGIPAACQPYHWRICFRQFPSESTTVVTCGDTTKPWCDFNFDACMSSTTTPTACVTSTVAATALPTGTSPLDGVPAECQQYHWRFCFRTFPEKYDTTMVTCGGETKSWCEFQFDACVSKKTPTGCVTSTTTTAAGSQTAMATLTATTAAATSTAAATTAKVANCGEKNEGNGMMTGIAVAVASGVIGGLLEKIVSLVAKGMYTNMERHRIK